MTLAQFEQIKKNFGRYCDTFVSFTKINRHNGKRENFSGLLKDYMDEGSMKNYLVIGQCGHNVAIHYSDVKL